MPTRTCPRCGCTFDTDRDLPRAGATPTRCPDCGYDTAKATDTDTTQESDTPPTADQGATNNPQAGQATPTPGRVNVQVNAELWQSFCEQRLPGETLDDVLRQYLHDQ